MRNEKAQRVASWIMLILLLILVPLTIWVSLSQRDSRRSDQRQEKTLEQQRASAARTDCVRERTAIQTEIIRRRDATGWDAILAQADRDFARYAERKAELRALNAQVLALDPIDVVVDAHCPKVETAPRSPKESR